MRRLNGIGRVAGTLACAVAGVLAVGVLRASADCRTWDLSGDWRMVQSNHITVTLARMQRTQRGWYWGQASYVGRVDGHNRLIHGSATAVNWITRSGENKVGVTVEWDLGFEQQWEATFVGGRLVDGDTYQTENPDGEHDGWSSPDSFRCLDIVKVPIDPSGLHKMEKAGTPHPHPWDEKVPPHPKPWREPAGGADRFPFCPAGLVLRRAGPSDEVCVSSRARVRVKAENLDGPSHRSPSGGAYGPDTCLPGFVWRDAFKGDHVCVTPQARDLAAAENRRQS